MVKTCTYTFPVFILETVVLPFFEDYGIRDFHCIEIKKGEYVVNVTIAPGLAQILEEEVSLTN